MASGKGSIHGIWHYPVKSLKGEPLRHGIIEQRRMAGDRYYALVNDQGKIASGKNTRRFFRLDGLFELSSRQDGSAVCIDFPDGTHIRCDQADADDIVSRYFGVPLRIRPERQISHLDDSPIHLITTSDLMHLELKHGTSVDPRRFSPNIVVDWPDSPGLAFKEGDCLHLGSAILRITSNTERCRMVTLAQADLPEDKPLLKSIAANKAVDFGYYADVVQPGRFSVGDSIEVKGTSSFAHDTPNRA